MNLLKIIVLFVLSLSTAAAQANYGPCGDIPRKIYTEDYFVAARDISLFDIHFVLVDDRTLASQGNSKIVGGLDYSASNPPHCDLPALEVTNNQGVKTFNVRGSYSSGGVATFRLCEYRYSRGERVLYRDSTMVCNFVTGD